MAGKLHTFDTPRSLARWPSWLCVLIGLWEMAAPFIWGYYNEQNALLNNLLTGGLMAGVGVWAAVSRTGWPNWWNIVLGVWLLFAPTVLRYRFITPVAGVNDAVVGAMAILLALTAWLIIFTWVPPAEQNGIEPV